MKVKALKFMAFVILVWLVPSWLVKACILWLFAAHMLSKP